MAKKLLDQLSDTLRTKHYSYRTEETYIDWVRRYILFHHKKHPAEMDAPEIRAFITHLAVERNVVASTQDQALSTTLRIILYREILNKESNPSASMPPDDPNACPLSSPAKKPPTSSNAAVWPSNLPSTFDLCPFEPLSP